MKKIFALPRSAQGQALILIALAAIGLFAITGLAIDGSAKFSDRRHAQNAADTAALAAALARADGLSNGKTSSVCSTVSGYSNSAFCLDIIYAAWQRAQDNGYDGLMPRSSVDVYSPPLSGVYSNCSDVHFNCNDYVQVIIDSNVNTYFARVIGINQIHNHVEAVASTVSQDNSFQFGGNAIVALKPSGCDALRAQGGAQIKIYGGGLYSNSDDASCSFFRQSCPSGSIGVFTDNTETTQGTITMVGNTTSSCGSTQAGLDSAATQISFPPPYQEIAEPAECSQTADLSANYTVTGSGSSKTATLRPGHFSTIPLSGQWKNIIFTPGVYCVNSTLNSPDTMSIDTSTPGGIMIYFKPGGYFTFNGGSVINLWGINSNNDSSLSAYQGFLMYVAPNYALTTPPNCKLNGNTDYALKGTIYAPYCAVTIDGTSNTGTFQSQVIGYTVNMAGTANVVLTYDSSQNVVWQIPWQVGLTK
jgi:hypothetical protein